MKVRIDCLTAVAFSTLAILATLSCGCKAVTPDRAHPKQRDTSSALDNEQFRSDNSQNLGEERGVDHNVGDTEKGVPRSAAAVDLSVLEDDNWFEQVQLGVIKHDPRFLRWRNQRLEPLLRLPTKDRPDLADSLASSNAMVAATAAIALAHWHTGQPAPALTAAVESTHLNCNLRCAAAEALGLVEHPSPAPMLRELLDEFGPGKCLICDQESQAENYNPDLQADLIRALARHAEPGDEKWFTEPLASPVANVRLQAILAWQSLPEQRLPELALNLRDDPDQHVRAAALRAIAIHCDLGAAQSVHHALAEGTAVMPKQAN